jgi:hypothetical protein
MHRRGSGARTAAWNKRPFAPPSLAYLRPPVDEATRMLADELIRAYSASDLMPRWVCSITVAPGSHSIFVLHFEPRFPDGRPYELAEYDFTWRELGEPVPAQGLSTYARLVYAHASEGLLGATHDTYEAWREAQLPGEKGSPMSIPQL